MDTITDATVLSEEPHGGTSTLGSQVTLGLSEEMTAPGNTPAVSTDEVGQAGPSTAKALTLDEAYAALPRDVTAKLATRALMTLDEDALSALETTPRDRQPGESVDRFQVRRQLQRQLSRLERMFG